MREFLVLLCATALLLRRTWAQSQRGNNNSFINPPAQGSDVSRSNFRIGGTIRAEWSSNYSTINLVLWSAFTFSDGNQNIIRLMSNERNSNGYEVLLGDNIDLSQGSNFFLEVHETDANNEGKETGASFRTVEFNIIASASSSTAAPLTITQTLGGTTIVLTPSSTPIETGSNTGTLASTTTGGPTVSPGPDNGGGGLSESGKVGVGVGVGIGVPLAAVAAAAVFLLLRRRRSRDLGDGLGIAHGADPSDTTSGVVKTEQGSGSSARYT